MGHKEVEKLNYDRAVCEDPKEESATRSVYEDKVLPFI